MSKRPSCATDVRGFPGRGMRDVGAILDLGRPGARIRHSEEKNVSRLFPHGFHTAGVVFSTEMDPMPSW